MANPDPDTVYNNAAAMRQDPRTPGLNSVLGAWAALQDFTGQNAATNYNQFTNLANLTRDLLP